MKNRSQNNMLISACLLGIKCRYDGTDSLNTELLELDSGDESRFIPVCPEQLGGLSTPREACEIENGSGSDVLDGNSKVKGRRSGADFTENFIRGAEQTLKLAQFMGCKIALFKCHSPSCGKVHIKRKGKTVKGDGVTTALLLRNNIEVQTVI